MKVVPIVDKAAQGASVGAGGATGNQTGGAVVHLLESEVNSQRALADALAAVGLTVATYGRGREFIDAAGAAARGCVLMNARLSDVDGLALLGEIAAKAPGLPVILYGGKANGSLCVVMPLVVTGRAGHSDGSLELAVIDKVTAALEIADGARAGRRAAASACARLTRLSKRELEVAQRMVAGDANKMIAFGLQISERTVEAHRASAMRKAGCDSLPALVWLFAAAGLGDGASNWPTAELSRHLHERARSAGDL